MKRALLLIVAVIIMIPSVASAYVASPRYGALELKFGPNRPDSRRFPGYADYFGNQENMVNAAIELDWQFAIIPEIISFGVGGQWGFMREKGSARVSGVSVTGIEVGEVESSDETSLNVMPFALLGVVRINVLADKLAIPFVPYYKIGLNWHLWWVKTAGEKEDSGGTMGWQMNPGIAFQLDWIDENTARTFDNEVGVNHSYLFFELVYSHADGFGKGNKLDLSPTNIGNYATWMAGLCLEF